VDNIRRNIVEVGWGDVDWIRIGTGGELSWIRYCWETIECPNNWGSLE
jgi:hypothetical protein